MKQLRKLEVIFTRRFVTVALLSLISVTLALMSSACKPRRGSRLAGAGGGATAQTNDMAWDGTPDWPAKWAEDLPVRGRSLFDQIYFAEAVPPKTFPELLKLLETKYAAEWNGVLIPHGRSLAAPRTSFTTASPQARSGPPTSSTSSAATRRPRRSNTSKSRAACSLI